MYSSSREKFADASAFQRAYFDALALMSASVRPWRGYIPLSW